MGASRLASSEKNQWQYRCCRLSGGPPPASLTPPTTIPHLLPFEQLHVDDVGPREVPAHPLAAPLHQRSQDHLVLVKRQLANLVL